MKRSTAVLGAVVVIVAAAAAVIAINAGAEGDQSSNGKGEKKSAAAKESAPAQTDVDQLTEELEQIPGVSTVETTVVEEEPDTVMVKLDEDSQESIAQTMSAVDAALEEAEPGSDIEIQAVGPHGSSLGEIDADAAPPQGGSELGASAPTPGESAPTPGEDGRRAPRSAG